MSPVITLRARQVAACALLLLLAAVAFVLLRAEQSVLWAPVEDAITYSGTDAGLITTPADWEGAH